MIWLFLLAMILAMAFFKMGALVVWFGVLKAAVQVLLFITGGFAFYSVWKWVARKRSGVSVGENPARIRRLGQRPGDRRAQTFDGR